MRLLLIALTCLFAGCASVEKPQEESVIPLSSPLEVAGDISSGLNVAVVEFDSVETTLAAPDRSLQQVRSLEARFMPYVLRRTLDESGFWGAVRVMPRPDDNVELNITAKVLASSGQVLSLHVKAVDAMNHVWLDKTYEDAATDLDYAADPVYQIDPFQDIYNRIANDLGRMLQSKEQLEKEKLRSVALLRYGQLLSPETFSSFLTEDEGSVTLLSLPAANDPMMARIERLRESEYLFSDGVDAYYGDLYRRLGQTYAWWRYYSYELTTGNERLDEVDPTRGATRGSWYAMERIYKTYRESRMNDDALRELTDSFDRETKPIVAEVSGRIVELEGSLEQQIDLWRLILADMYQQEVMTVPR